MDRRSLAKLALVVPVLAIAGCGGGDDTSPAVTDTPPAAAPSTPPATTPPPGGAATGAGADLVAQGRQVYAGAGICFTCHGPEGQGTPLGPNLADGNWIWITEPQQDLQTKLVTLIRTGVAQPREYPAPMPPMGGASLSEDQLQAVSAFVASLNQ